MVMSEIQIVISGGRRRRWSAAKQPRIVEETMYRGGEHFTCRRSAA